MQSEDYLPGNTVIPAAVGWRVHYVSRSDGPGDLGDFLQRPADSVIAWHIGPQGWARPIVPGEQFAFEQDYILRSPEGSFITSDCGSFASLSEAYSSIRPTTR